MNKDISIIPKGMYCYKRLELIKDGGYKIIGLCPYWFKRKDKPKHSNGYCAFLGKGDWEINQEEEWENIDTGEMVKGMFSLIWDMVKECEINKTEEE